MGGRYKLVFWGAILVAAAATFGAYRLLAANSRAEVATRPVVVANRDIPEGVTIDRIALSAAQWPMQAVPVGAFASIDSVAGRVARVAVYNGEAIVPGRLAPVGTGPGLELKIPPGQRAMAVRINDVAGISGLLQPNSRVDVLVTIRDDAAADKQVAKLFMSNMLVLSVGTEIQRDAQGKPNNAATVTLAVTPEEAERLAIAMNTGAIQLVLRGYGDPDSVRTKGASSGDVLNQLKGTSTLVPAPSKAAPPRIVYRPLPAPKPEPKKEPPPPPPDSARVDVYRAGKAAQQKFDTVTKR
ncbi:MAG TPA: Flp pilus assembly protein CpaB [Gemmatimonadaceae bacterium]|nr:Flp pilus assembly protein CpaB [Gemmatimonadaceae bacterium]